MSLVQPLRPDMGESRFGLSAFMEAIPGRTTMMLSGSTCAYRATQSVYRLCCLKPEIVDVICEQI